MYNVTALWYTQEAFMPGSATGSSSFVGSQELPIIAIVFEGSTVCLFYLSLGRGRPGNIQAVNKASIVRHLHGFSLSLSSHIVNKPAVIDIYDVELSFK